MKAKYQGYTEGDKTVEMINETLKLFESETLHNKPTKPEQSILSFARDGIMNFTDSDKKCLEAIFTPSKISGE